MKHLTNALFLDLDHTLITTKSGRIFPLHSEDWRFIPETLKTIKHYYLEGFKIILISNQGGIEEGYLTEKVFIHKIEAICKALEKTLKLKKNSTSYFYCTTMLGYNRKPNPGMAFEAAIEYELDMVNSIMVGDLESDRKFAKNSGIGSFYYVTDLVTLNLDNAE